MGIPDCHHNQQAGMDRPGSVLYSLTTLLISVWMISRIINELRSHLSVIPKSINNAAKKVLVKFAYRGHIGGKRKLARRGIGDKGPHEMDSHFASWVWFACFLRDAAQH